MASGSAGSVALLSIRPCYASSIISGYKTVEFRKTRFRNPVEHIVLYASRPTSMIVAYFEVDGIDEDSPKQLWPRYASQGGISYQEFKKYFRNSLRGVAINVGKVYPLRNPLSISSLGRSLPIQQSFIYLTNETLGTMLKMI